MNIINNQNSVTLEYIRILKNNYIWILYDINRLCLVIDPGVSNLVINYIKRKKMNPVAVLLTHHHQDHIGGVQKIIKNYPNIMILGPKETKKYGANKIVDNGTQIELINRKFYVLSTPGHTLGHISYYSKPYLFCGDTLFSGGCGMIYNKEYLKMYFSLKRICLLPEKTVLCCSHEYTLSNLIFAMSILPNDKLIQLYFHLMKKKYSFDKTTLPSSLFIEKRINLFLRTNECALKKSLKLSIKSTSFETFVALRKRKDFFKFGAKRD